MSVLEKILQEIEEKAVCGRNKEHGFVNMKYVNEIIKNHMEQNKWIPCSVRMPDKPDECYGEKGYIVQVDDIIEPFSAYWDGEKFTDSEDCIVEDVIAWCPLPEPYNPERRKHDC